MDMTSKRHDFQNRRGIASVGKSKAVSEVPAVKESTVGEDGCDVRHARASTANNDTLLGSKHIGPKTENIMHEPWIYLTLTTSERDQYIDKEYMWKDRLRCPNCGQVFVGKANTKSHLDKCIKPEYHKYKFQVLELLAKPEEERRRIIRQAILCGKQPCFICYKFYTNWFLLQYHITRCSIKNSADLKPLVFTGRTAEEQKRQRVSYHGRRSLIPILRFKTLGHPPLPRDNSLRTLERESNKSDLQEVVEKSEEVEESEEGGYQTMDEVQKGIHRTSSPHATGKVMASSDQLPSLPDLPPPSRPPVLPLKSDRNTIQTASAEPIVGSKIVLILAELRRQNCLSSVDLLLQLDEYVRDMGGREQHSKRLIYAAIEEHIFHVDDEVRTQSRKVLQSLLTEKINSSSEGYAELIHM